MTRSEHQRVVGLFRVFTQHLVGYNSGRAGEIDVVQMIFGDAVGGDDDEVAGAQSYYLRRSDLGYAVTDDACGKACAGSDVDAGGSFGDQVPGDVADPGPGERAGPEIHPRQCDSCPSTAGQDPVAELNQDL